MLVGLTRKGCRTSAVPGEGRYVADRTRLRRLLAAGVVATIAALTVTTQGQAASHQWSIVSSPNGASYNELYGVSCVSTSFCMAVGYVHSDVGLTLIEEWDGSRWSLVGSPNPSGSVSSGLQAVSCVTSSFCMAVGESETGTGGVPTLMERWDGTTWNLVSSPNATASGSLVWGVSCVSASFCMAVGLSYGGWLPLIEEWDGSSWTLVNSPSISMGGAFLRGVSCLSSTFCMAVGEYYDGASNSFQTLTEKWNGSTWSLVGSPRSTHTFNGFYSVSCTSRSFCMATGWFDNSQILIEQWDGRRWRIVNSPSLASGALISVSCTSRSFCMGAGANWNFHVTLTEHSDGSRWKLVSSPNPGAPGFPNGVLWSVSCTSNSFCVATGGYYDGFGKRLTLTEEWSSASDSDTGEFAP